MDIQEIISKQVKLAIKSIYKADLESVEFQATRKEFEGDITVVVFPMLRVVKGNPFKIGEDIGRYLVENVLEIKTFNVVKGFLNIVNELIINYKSSSIIQDLDLNSNLFQLSEIVEIELINNDFDLNIVFNWYKNQLDHILRISTGEDFLTKDYNLQNGINLSTIHSSKGLEFDVVLCPYLSIISNNLNKIKSSLNDINEDLVKLYELQKDSIGPINTIKKLFLDAKIIFLRHCILFSRYSKLGGRVTNF